ncbi:hypothetical protein Pcinc_018477 [Petrolisthes cinctipes]|uniref:Uncharacterized protein n=1 Tax=Petrolisthes cinctipes TaxID=88211 RepID=A0AAE1FMD8_PETCI|nr:hypothetical protein Pcinc_018477 [Petrolisthes cinctipes]
MSLEDIHTAAGRLTCFSVHITERRYFAGEASRDLHGFYLLNLLGSTADSSTRALTTPAGFSIGTVRHRSEELRRKLAEENRKMRERFEAREREWEAGVDRSLLQPEDLEIYEAHKAAVARGHFTYDDPYTGYRVMTRLRHYWRGSCCGNACRHCIYEHDNVAEREKAQRVSNSAFWVDAKDRPDLRRQKTRTKTLREGSSSQPSLQHTTDDEIDDDIDPLLFKH